LELHKFAAIDIGTNAVRLLFSNVIEEEDNATFKKNSLIRVPIRLGEDVFNGGLIRPGKINQLIDAMIAFRHLINIHQVERYRACATSAMREAENGQKVVELVKEKAGLDIEIIDGATEAEIIYENKIADIVNDNKNYLYVDIGGGSTEITLFQQGIPIRSHSFNIGTVRLLNKQVTKKEKKYMKHWVRELTEEHPNITVIGSGGNVNKLFKLSHYKEQQVIPYKVIKKIYEDIKSHSYEERIKDLGMNPDRADVIIPASKLFLKIMKWADTQEAIIPKIGIADGIVRRLYADYRNERKQVSTAV